MKRFLFLFLAMTMAVFADPRMDAMVVHFDQDGDGSLSSKEMLEMTLELEAVLRLEIPKPEKAPLPEKSATAKPEMTPETTEVEEPTERELYLKRVEEARLAVVEWCDKDGDAKLSREEKQALTDALRGDIQGKAIGEKNQEMIDKVILAFDQDGSKSLSTKEKSEAVIYVEQQYTKSEDHFKKLQDKVIKQLDKDDNWLLSVEEKNRAQDLLRGTTKEEGLSEDFVRAFDFDDNGTLSTTERKEAMELIVAYYKPVPLLTDNKKGGNKGGGGGKNEDADAPLETEINPEYIAANFLDGHDGDLNKSLKYEELVEALKQAQQDGLFRTRKPTIASLRQDRVSKIETLRGELMLFFDRDKNESISREEENFARDALRGKIPGERVGENDDVMVAKVIRAFDTDGTGTISNSERDVAIKALKKHYAPVPIETGEEKKVEPKKNSKKKK